MKRKTFLRSLSVMLAVVLVVSIMPIDASAIRCKHDHGTHWERLGTYTHCEICDTCGSRLRCGGVYN